MITYHTFHQIHHLHHLRGQPAVPNPGYLDFANHYGFEIKACGVRQPQHKGRVEKGVDYIKGNFLIGLELTTFEPINPAARIWLETVANVRHHLKDHGGNLGTTGSVGFLFQRQGVFRLSPQGIDRDSLELELIDHGLIALEDGESDKAEAQLVVRCAFGDFGAMQAAIESRGLTPISSQSEYVAGSLTELPEGKLDEVMELVAALDGDDDVQNVYTNLA